MEAGGGDNHGGNPFVCNICRKTYGRIDHLARHFRSHTNEKPFKCVDCGKTFARADLLKRHATLHTATEQSGKKRKIRASQACAACATIKVKCDQDKPCKRCRLKGLECRVDAASSASALRSNDHTPQASPSDRWTAPSDADPPRPVDYRPVSGQLPLHSHAPGLPLTQQPHMPSPYQTPPMLEDSTLTDFLNNVLHSSEASNIPPHLQPNQNGTWNGDFAPRDVMDFSQDLSMDFNDLDTVLAGGWDTWLDPALAPTTLSQTAPQSVSDVSTPSIDDSINMGAAAYTRSAWRWIPSHEVGNQDHALASALVDGNSSDLLSRTRQALAQPLDLSERDRMVALLLAGCEKTNYQKIVSLFPAPNILDVFLNDFLLTMEHNIDSWVHIPTLRPSEMVPELLTLMISAGAILSRTSHGQKFGYALQEKTRVAIPDMFERDNRNSRSLQALQAYAICLDVGTWSGNKRTMELAEASGLPLITMLRRSGGFRRSRGLAPGPGHDDTLSSLDHKWRTWVEAESFKRLAYHVFLYSVQRSVAFQTPPLLSYAEITLELPAPQALWRAKSAEEWRDQYYAHRLGQQLPTFVSSMCDPQTLGMVRDKIDLELSLYLVLLSHWCLAWEHSQLSSANKAQTNPDVQWAGTMLATSKCQELRRLLDSFYCSIEAWNVFVPKEVHMMSQLLRMNLCVSFEDLQLLAGKEGRDEAKRVFPSLMQWFHTPGCRQAVWHAGQVLRAARRPAGRSPNASRSAASDAPWLRDFNAVALYHAGLAFWVYGLLSRTITAGLNYEHATNEGSQMPRRSNYASAIDYDGELIPVDGDDEQLTAIQRHHFIGANRGRAVISTVSPWSRGLVASTSAPVVSPSSGGANGPRVEPAVLATVNPPEVVVLDDPRRVMEVMIHALTPASQPPGSSRSNPQPTGPQRPAMVENLIQLMRDLGEAASSVL